MPNPRYLSKEGIPTVELLGKLYLAKQVFHSNLGWFCETHGFQAEELKNIAGVYLIGSHAEEDGWNDNTSDLDIKLVNGSAFPENLHRYKREVLDKLLHQGEKRRWVDLFFVGEEYQVTQPWWDLTEYWSRLEV